MLETVRRLVGADWRAVPGILPVPPRGVLHNRDAGAAAYSRKGRPIFPIAGGAPQAAVLERTGAEEASAGGQAPRVVVPFQRAAHRVMEGSFFDVSQAVGSAAVQLGPYDVPARGYARSIVLVVECSGGVLGAGALHEDYPWRLLGNVNLRTPNGADLFGPISGYGTYLTNLFGGYDFETDPTADPDYVGTINATFVLRIPIEITGRDGFGAIANQNAAAAYRLYVTLAATGDAFTTAPTTPPTVRIRGWLEAWTQPPPSDQFGNPNQTEPPAHGTTQYWSDQTYAVNSGDQSVRLTRMGNLIRNLILIYRTGAPRTRSTVNFPDPVRLMWDSREILSAPRIYLRSKNYRQTGRTPPTGVFLLTFTDEDGHVGAEDRVLYLPTVQPTRLELEGPNFGAAGDLTVLTNDIAPVGAPIRPEG